MVISIDSVELLTIVFILQLVGSIIVACLAILYVVAPRIEKRVQENMTMWVKISSDAHERAQTFPKRTHDNQEKILIDVGTLTKEFLHMRSLHELALTHGILCYRCRGAVVNGIRTERSIISREEGSGD